MSNSKRQDALCWRLNTFFSGLPRIFCFLWESLRYIVRKIFPFKENTPSWYVFCARRDEGGRDKTFSAPGADRLDGSWFSVRRPFYFHEHIFYDFDSALRLYPDLKGIAFIFFMGIGDYLYASPLFPALKNKYPSLDFRAYVGDKNDRNNSSLVASVLKSNPCFSGVDFYSGGRRNPVIWKNYDYRTVIGEIPDGYLAVPVYYDYSMSVPHRTESLFDTFGLKPGEKFAEGSFPVPQMYFPGQPSETVKDYYETICEKAGEKKKIVVLQLDSRGSDYTYPYIGELASMLCRDFFVISVTKSGFVNGSYLELDTGRIVINDSFRLLHMLKGRFEVYIIAVNSVFWAASAGLGISNLGLQHWKDIKLHNLWYPNITFLTKDIYDRIPGRYQILAGPRDYLRHNKKIIDFKPEFIFRHFMSMAGMPEPF